jgi:hypothetical protein
MAIAQYDYVTLHNDVPAALSSIVQTQPPMFGLVTSIDAAVVDVLWENAKVTLDLEPVVLDQIYIPTAPLDPARVVRVNLTGVELNSNEFQGTIVSQYRRQAAGGGAVSADLVLIKTLDGKQFLEVLQSQVELVDGE